MILNQKTRRLLQQYKNGDVSFKALSEIVVALKSRYPNNYRNELDLRSHIYPVLEQFGDLPAFVQSMVESKVISLNVLRYWATNPHPEKKELFLKALLLSKSLDEVKDMTWGQIEREVQSSSYKPPSSDFMDNLSSQTRRSLGQVAWDKDKKDCPLGTPACNGCPHNIKAGTRPMCFNVECYEKKEQFQIASEVAEIRRKVALKVVDPFEFDTTGNSRKIFNGQLFKLALALAETGENRFPELPEYQNLLAMKGKSKTVQRALIDSMRYYIERLQGDDLWVFAARLDPECVEGI
jgi:hypothetical protein